MTPQMSDMLLQLVVNTNGGRVERSTKSHELTRTEPLNPKHQRRHILFSCELTTHDKKLTRRANEMLTERDAFCFHNSGKVN
jgi:hypothetical protein